MPQREEIPWANFTEHRKSFYGGRLLIADERHSKSTLTLAQLQWRDDPQRISPLTESHRHCKLQNKEINSVGHLSAIKLAEQPEIVTS